MPTTLSPKMIGMLTWLARENRPVNVANVQTVEALVRRGLLTYVMPAGSPPIYGAPVMVTDAGRQAVATERS